MPHIGQLTNKLLIYFIHLLIYYSFDFILNFVVWCSALAAMNQSQAQQI